jgi:hypothetical protein
MVARISSILRISATSMRPDVSAATRRQYAATRTLGHLWLAFPGEHDTLRPYVDRAKSYRNDCGCAAGGFFVAVTIVTLIFYGIAYRGYYVDHWLAGLISAAAYLFGAAFAGKMLGIGLARVRLVLLGHELRRRYAAILS